jgi:hypothetical protein
VPVIRFSLSLLICVSSLCAGQDLTPQHFRLFTASAQLIQIGVRSSPDGEHVPIWAITMGDTAKAERVAHFYHGLGPYGLNATLWTHAEEGAGWVRTTYRRPRNIDEFIAWHDDARPFTFRAEGDASLLPLPFAGLASDLAGKVDFIIRYDDGSAKAYLYPGTSTADAKRVVAALSEVE